jgi:hypothetical protein
MNEDLNKCVEEIRPRERVEKFVSTHTRTCDRIPTTSDHHLTTANEIVKIDDETKFPYLQTFRNNRYPDHVPRALRVS